jgi:hypothetical protein
MSLRQNLKKSGLSLRSFKCFERLVMANMTSIIPGPHQFANHPSRAIDDTILIALHTPLTHQDKRNTYVRMLII